MKGMRIATLLALVPFLIAGDCGGPVGPVSLTPNLFRVEILPPGDGAPAHEVVPGESVTLTVRVSNGVGIKSAIAMWLSVPDPASAIFDQNGASNIGKKLEHPNDVSKDTAQQLWLVPEETRDFTVTVTVGIDYPAEEFLVVLDAHAYSEGVPRTSEAPDWNLDTESATAEVRLLPANPCVGCSYTVGGTVGGLSGTVVLQNNGGDDLALTLNGAFTFDTPVADGLSYDVRVLTDPSGQTCHVTNGTGTIAGANVDDVMVTCGDNGAAAGLIAFESERDGNRDIYVMNPDGSGVRRLTSNPEVDVDASWSPDGTQIVFASERDGDDEIYIMNADGSNKTQLTHNTVHDWNPAWSSDGRIAFRSERDGNDEIYVMNADGSGVIRLTNNPATDAEPAWSHDGSLIAFVSDRDGNDEIYVMNADGSAQRNVTLNAASDVEPAWSPVGDRIAFASDRAGNEDIYVMNTDGSGQTRVTSNSAEDDDPTWSPDGTHIAFTSFRDGNYEIYIIKADGSSPTNVTMNSAYDDKAAWSR